MTCDQETGPLAAFFIFYSYTLQHAELRLGSPSATGLFIRFTLAMTISRIVPSNSINQLTPT